MADPDRCEDEVHELREALKGEHRLLKEVQAVLFEGTPPDVPAEETINRLYDVGQGLGMDPAPEMERAEKALDRTGTPAIRRAQRT